MYQQMSRPHLVGMKPSHTARIYTRTLHAITATAFLLGAALVVTIDYAESVDTSHTAYGNEPWEFVSQ